MASETVENYVKAIYTLREEGEGGAGSTVALGDVAAAVGVTPGTATTMVKKLARDKLAKYERYGGVTLTVRGEKMALAVLRRHRLIETFLVRTLGMDWSEVHDEAERLEHAISDRMLEKLDAFLGHPAVDPHGDPIPDANGRLREAALVAVARCTPGATVRLARVLDQRADFLRFLDRHRIRIGALLIVERAEPGAGTVTVRVEEREVTIGEAAAANLMGEAVGGAKMNR
jgi:DtxR family Mn-dependent transcriptional regulator